MTPQEIQIRFAENLLKAMEYVASQTKITTTKLAKKLNISVQESETILRHITI